MTVTETMSAAGWRYDAATHGFRKRSDATQWVTYGQAEAAIANAERGVEAGPKLPASEMVARAIAGVANDA